MSNKSGVASSVISLPTGGGAIKGMGDTFAQDPFTGTARLEVPITLPPGRNSLQPDLRLTYSPGAGNGPFGLGWSLNLPGISRRTDRGIPRYRCVFRTDSTTHFGRIRPRISGQIDHSLRLKSTTRYG